MDYQETIKEAETQIDMYESMILYNKDFEPKNDNSNYERKLDFLKTAISTMRELEKYKKFGALKEVRKAVEKQKPEKVTIEDVGYNQYRNVNLYACICPSCGLHIIEFDVERDGTVIAYINPESGDSYEPTEIFRYQTGDILYVRETWDNLPVNPDGTYCGYNKYYYRADGDMRPEGWKGSWKPSIHMLKEAARIFLKVTDVRVELLQEIDDKGVLEEGLEIGEPFDELWDSTCKKNLQVYGWDANPWVWVIEFERVVEE